MFTFPRIQIYLGASARSSLRRSLQNVAPVLKGMVLWLKWVIRKRSASEKPLAFISHDSRDKDGLLRQLAHEMVRLLCPVWYDEYSLKVGDSRLRANIEKGLKEARKCIIILSPNFLSNEGWSKADLIRYSRARSWKERMLSCRFGTMSELRRFITTVLVLLIKSASHHCLASRTSHDD